MADGKDHRKHIILNNLSHLSNQDTPIIQMTQTFQTYQKLSATT